MRIAASILPIRKRRPRSPAGRSRHETWPPDRPSRIGRRAMRRTSLPGGSANQVCRRAHREVAGLLWPPRVVVGIAIPSVRFLGSLETTNHDLLDVLGVTENEIVILGEGALKIDGRIGALPRDLGQEVLFAEQLAEHHLQMVDLAVIDTHPQRS